MRLMGSHHRSTERTEDTEQIWCLVLRAIALYYLLQDG